MIFFTFGPTKSGLAAHPAPTPLHMTLVHIKNALWSLRRGRSNVVIIACYRNIINRIVLMEYNLFSFRHKKFLLPLNLSNFYIYSFFYLLPCAKLLTAQGTVVYNSIFWMMSSGFLTLTEKLTAPSFQVTGQGRLNA